MAVSIRTNSIYPVVCMPMGGYWPAWTVFMRTQPGWPVCWVLCSRLHGPKITRSTASALRRGAQFFRRILGRLLGELLSINSKVSSIQTRMMGAQLPALLWVLGSRQPVESKESFWFLSLELNSSMYFSPFANIWILNYIRYGVGQVAIFYASQLLHKVAAWKPPPKGLNDQHTPGRIGNVFFFPRVSLELLEHKPPGWAVRTGLGRYPDSSSS